MSTQPAHAESQAFVRLVNANPALGVVDIFMDEKKIVEKLSFTGVTRYTDVTSGFHVLRVAVAGSGNILLSGTTSLLQNGTYTVAITGKGETDKKIVVFQDNNQIAGAETKVRVYHLFAGGDTFDVTTSDVEIATGLAYMQASAYASVQPGNYVFNVTLHPLDDMQPVAATIDPWTVISIFALPDVDAARVQFVVTHTQGLPGMPGTGSVPYPLVIDLGGRVNTMNVQYRTR